MKRERLLSLCLASLLALSLTACNGPTDEENSAQPTPSVQPTPTAAPTPTPEPTPPIPFTDVTQDSPYYDVLVWAYEKGIASDGETFKPGDPCTRGQAMTFLWRAMGSPEPRAAGSPFSDVSSDDWFCKPALWAYEKGVTAGTAFNPESSCTSGEALTFLWRAQGSPLVLASSDAYYARPLAWAENNGLFAGQDAPFDPDAPCSRGDLMTYLYWAVEEWAFPEEDKTIQAEYEKILHDTTPFTSYSPGLLYADYVDVDNDGRVELLTVDSGENLSDAPGWTAYIATATVYGYVDGHFKKICEQGFDCTSSEGSVYLCTYDGHISFRYETLIHGVGPQYDFYTLENGAFVLSDTIANVMDRFANTEGDNISETEFNAIMEKYTDKKSLFWYSGGDISINEQGIVPTQEEYDTYWENYWTEYWAAADPMYAAVVNGDLSAFAGSYTSSRSTMSIDKNGVITETDDFIATNQKPISITITEDGAIKCVLKDVEPDWNSSETFYEAFEICPIGIEYELFGASQTDASKVRIISSWSAPNTWDSDCYYKTS